MTVNATTAPTSGFTAQGEREIARVLAQILAERYPGTRWAPTTSEAVQ